MKNQHIYLAARYSRREELCNYRDQLRDMGYTVVSRWLDGKHQIANDGTPIGDHGEALVETSDGDKSTNIKAAELRSSFATDDFSDVRSANIVISFTEPPRSNHSRGGRHVEFGVALAWQAITGNGRIIVVGHRENIFHWLGCVEFYKTWDECKNALRSSF